jgi:hypothetical protein
MKWSEYKELMKAEWHFHSRNPELLLVWFVILGSVGFLIFKHLHP